MRIIGIGMFHVFQVEFCLYCVVGELPADVDNVAAETSADRCCSRLFAVRSLIGHNGIITALAMSDRVVVSARCLATTVLPSKYQ